MSSEDLRMIPATVTDGQGRATGPRVEIVSPMWTRAELESLVRGEDERGWITREEADRLIAEGREKLRADGTPRERPRGDDDRSGR